MAKIYRFEDSEGVGMYFATEVAHTRLSGLNHPGPWSDGKLYSALEKKSYPANAHDELKKHKFGFSSKRQMTRWVNRKQWLKELHEHGIVLAEYICHPQDVIKGDTQAIFKDHISKQQFDIPSYFGLKVLDKAQVAATI